MKEVNEGSKAEVKQLNKPQIYSTSHNFDNNLDSGN